MIIIAIYYLTCLIVWWFMDGRNLAEEYKELSPENRKSHYAWMATSSRSPTRMIEDQKKVDAIDRRRCFMKAILMMLICPIVVPALLVLEVVERLFPQWGR